MRWQLALRALLLAPALAAFGLGVLHDATLAGASCLTALLILLCDFRRPNVGAYVITGIACLVATALGSLALPTAATVALVVVVSAALGVNKGFGGFAGVASVTVVAELLIAVGLRTAGAPTSSVLWGVSAGGLLAVVVGVLLPADEQPLPRLTSELTTSCALALEGGAVPDVRPLVMTYLESSDRPQAPTRASADALHRLNSLARLGDLLAQSHETDGFTRACAGALRGGPVPIGTTAWQMQVAYAVDVIVSPHPASSGEWLRQLRVRLRPDSLLFVQAALAAALYGSLTLLVLVLKPPHPQWILLGAVTATYPYARRSAIVVRSLLLATVLGFGALLLVAPVANSHPAVWWLVFVAAVGVSCGVPHSTRGWIVGQVAFTSLSLSLLALAAGHLPAEAIVVRFENVLIGGAAAVLVALVLAPRHMRRRLQLALAALYEASDLDLSRAHFLRCTDVFESMRGSGYIPLDVLVRWLDAAREIVAVGVVRVLVGVSDEGHSQACAGALRGNLPVPEYAGCDDLAAPFEAAREDLWDLSPLQPRSAFEG